MYRNRSRSWDLPWMADTTAIEPAILPRPLPEEPAPSPDENASNNSYGSSSDMEDVEAACAGPSNWRREVLDVKAIGSRNALDRLDSKPSLEQESSPSRRDTGGNVGAVVAAILGAEAASTSALGTTMNGAALLRINSQLYWSYTFTIPKSCNFAKVTSYTTTTPTLSSAASFYATAIRRSAIVTSLPGASDLPCSYSEDPHATTPGACVCINGKTISASESDGQFCPWPTLPPPAVTFALPKPREPRPGEMQRLLLVLECLRRWSLR